MYSLEPAREILSIVLVIGSAVCACGDNPHVRYFEEGGKGDRSFDCKGYTVEGAGNSSFNGCYLPSKRLDTGRLNMHLTVAISSSSGEVEPGASASQAVCAAIQQAM